VEIILSIVLEFLLTAILIINACLYTTYMFGFSCSLAKFFFAGNCSWAAASACEAGCVSSEVSLWAATLQFGAGDASTIAHCILQSFMPSAVALIAGSTLVSSTYLSLFECQNCC
jgi:hypothetical protein